MTSPAPSSHRRTALYDFHLAHGKMTEFAGYDMPIWYASAVEEHMAVRNRVGIFDVSHMGRVNVSGPDATALLERLFPTDVASQPTGKCVYTLLLNERAGIIDDLIFLKQGATSYLVVVNAATHQSDVVHMRERSTGLDVDIVDITDSTTMIAVQGPAAAATLQPLTKKPLGEIGRFTHADSPTLGVPTTIARTGYTGEDGYEMILHSAGLQDAQRALGIWGALLKEGATPCALGARDSLRLEAGLPLYGSDINEETNPIEANLGWVVSKTKRPSSYVGGEALALHIGRPPDRTRRGILMEEKIPRRGFAVTDRAGSEVGVVTSGSFSPLLKKGIAMAYVKWGTSNPGDTVYVTVRGASANGSVVKFPFYDPASYGWKRRSNSI